MGRECRRTLMNSDTVSITWRPCLHCRKIGQRENTTHSSPRTSIPTKTCVLCLVSCVSATQALDKIINTYFVRFHWSLPHTSLPGELPTVRFDPDGFEILSAEEAAHKGKVIGAMKKTIYKWYNHRNKAAPTLPRSKSGNKDDPIAMLLRRLLSNPSPPKRRAAWEAWGKENFQSLKSDFDAKFEATNGVEKNRVKACNEFKRQEFKKLSEDEKKKWSDLVHLEWEDAKQLLKDQDSVPKLLDPADAQKVLDTLPSIMGPLIEGVGEAIGMHVTVLVGGPEPKRQGQLNSFSMHYGVDKQPVPKVWGHADKAGFKLVTNAFTAFLETCYSPEEQRVRAMLKDSPQDDQTHPTNSPSDSSQAPPTSVQPPSRPSASKSSESVLSTHVGGKHKRSVKAKDGKGKKQKKQKKKRVFVVSYDDNEDNDEEEEEDDDDDKENAGNNNRLKSLNPNTITPFEEPSTLTDGPTVAMPHPPAQSAQLDQFQFDQSVPRSPLAPSGTPLSGPVGTAIGTPQLAPKPPLPLDPSWPAWFQKAYTNLSLTFLSPELTSAIQIYVGIKKEAGFMVGSPNAGFKVDNRPPEVAFWVGRGRKSVPLFEAGWWKWWKGLQPKWRSAVEVEGPLTATHREVTDGEGGWASVDKHGQNAFLTVLSCLVWWGTALNGHQGESAAWTAAVDNTFHSSTDSYRIPRIPAGIDRNPTGIDRNFSTDLYFSIPPTIPL
ncbi:uncharacterized protein LACBIDRAFT_312075 [Laccaria bicolor S238N-H82]|uniref:Predicted protein n=1 Tax=Laccaria bicolor (strain S238N-H82 / ATCC MYA-4686) TaxID=486041 RepID=B0CZ11_LACBS|nr:uncharacterized protein LACBIDRAFT_312075 [Laccaria bicolor S238N-H82]EDR12543.1 predicted protein [Laccaria bicolor S238N-H82]|eukprot:XP_001876807.1 predicted protein [Laccaria bicolor S238N-H82]